MRHTAPLAAVAFVLASSCILPSGGADASVDASVNTPDASVDAGGMDASTEDMDASTGPVCPGACLGEGPACDLAGSNRIGRCALDADSGCRIVSALADCPGGSPVCVAGTGACVMAGYVVATDGRDSNPGTAALPFATLAHARDVVRGANANMTGDIAVYLRAGDYPLAASDCTYGNSSTPSPAGLCFDERDSASNGHKIRYASSDGVGSARLLGAVRVTGWQPYLGNVYRAAWSGLPFNDLFENGVRAIKARSPNINAGYGVSTTSQGPYFETAAPGTADTTKQLVYAPGDLPAPTWDATDGHVQVEIFSGGVPGTFNYNWFNDLDEVVGLDPSAHVITLRVPTSYTIQSGSRFSIQGDLAFLDAPGEFFVGGGFVYYYPRSTPIEAQEILAPQVKAIIQFCPRFQPAEVPLATQGGLCGHTATVHDITLSGLTLEASEFTTEYPDRTAAGSDPSGMVYLESTHDITVESCHLKNAGQNAIALNYDNANDTIYGNWIESSGLAAVVVRTLAMYTGHPATGGHRIGNNKVDFVGMHQTGVPGIYDEGATGIVVDRNTVAHGPRGLISGAFDAPAPATGTYYGYNALFSGCEDSADNAPFYYFSICANTPCTATDTNLAHMPQKTVEQLRIDTAVWDPASQLTPSRSLPPWGFYLDNSSSNWTLRNIAVTNVAPSPNNQSVRLYNGGVNITEDNVSWSAGFDPSRMDDDNIGLRPDFPSAYWSDGVTWTNDDSPACTHSAGWLYRNDPAVSDDFGRDETYTNTPGESLECTFTGTEVRWLTASGNNRGTADAYLDGAFVATVDLYTLAYVNQRIVWRHGGLAAGPHTLRIVVRSDRMATLNYVVVDAIGAK